MAGGFVARAGVGIAACVRRVVGGACPKVGTIVGGCAGVDGTSAAAIRIAVAWLPWRVVSTAAASPTTLKFTSTTLGRMMLNRYLL